MIRLVGAVVALTAVLTACARAGPPAPVGAPPGSGRGPTPTSTRPPPAVYPPAPSPSPTQSRPGALQLVVEPDAGFGPAYDQMASPTRGLDLVVYELVDPRAEAILAADAARGVRVRVLLDRNLEESANAAAYRYLQARGVSVEWAGPSYAATHEKAMVIDGVRLVVMTANLTARYYADTRDFVVVDGDGADAAAADAAFNADWGGGAAPAGVGDHLVWSPGSASELEGLIDGARHSLLVENEEMSAPDLLSALTRAARRGVDVQVTMTSSAEWQRAFRQLEAAGVHVAVMAQDAALYVHAKAIVADPGMSDVRFFVGSENFSVASLERNRELGVISGDPTVAAALATVLARDQAAAAPWTAGA